MFKKDRLKKTEKTIYYYITLSHKKKRTTKKDTIKSSQVSSHIEILEKLLKRYIRHFPGHQITIESLVENTIDSGFMPKRRNSQKIIDFPPPGQNILPTHP